MDIITLFCKIDDFFLAYEKWQTTHLETLCCVRFLVGIRSTQPTRGFNFYFQTRVN